MAAVSSARLAGSLPKPKKPIPTALQTSPNGLRSTSSPSPSLASKRLPPGAQASTSAGTGLSNGNITPNGTGPRMMRRKDSQKLGDGARPKIARPMVETPTISSARPLKRAQEPYVKTTSWLLKKYRKARPSFILHLHPQYFRFDQQDGSFSYTSPMRVLLEHVKNQTVPLEMLEDLHAAGIKFYECCLIVQIHDHRNTSSSATSSSGINSNDQNQPFSIHNYTPYVTPSASVPYPNSKPVEEPEKPETAEDKDKRPADGEAEAAQGPRIFTTVLFPTAMTLQDDLMRIPALRDAILRKQAAPNGQPPLKKVKTQMSNATLQNIEAEITLATAPPLFLEPVNDINEMKQLYTKLADPLCNRQPPAPKSRKRTVAELAADEALAAEQQKFMLVMDERLAPSSTTAATSKATVADAEANSNATEARFERFKVLEDIKEGLREKKERENEARLLQQQQSLAAQQQQVQMRTKMEQERAMQEAAKAREMQAKKQEQQLQAQRAQAASSQSAVPRSQGSPMQLPAGPGQQGQVNTMLTNAQQLAASQAAHPSPIVRHMTPQNAPSPAMGNMITRPQGVSMTISSSSQGVGSPQRPPSAVSLGQPGGVAMMPQRSQQPPSRHGTPAMINGTPRIQQATPIMRNVTPTPRMTQASPISYTSATPMNGLLGVAHMGGQPQLTPQQQHLIQQHQRQQAAVLEAARQQQVMQHGGVARQPMNPQQIQAVAQAQAQARANMQAMAQQIHQQQMQQQQQQQQHGGQHMPNGLMMGGQLQGGQPQLSADEVLQRTMTIVYKKALTEYLGQLKVSYGNEANIPPQQIEAARQRAMMYARSAAEQRRRQLQQQAATAQAQAQQQQVNLFAQMQRMGHMNGQMNGMGNMGNMGSM